VIVSAGCTDDSDSASAVANGKITATIDGEDYETDAFSSYVASDNMTLISSTNENSSLGDLTISVPLAPGETGSFNTLDNRTEGIFVTYSIGETDYSTFTQEAFTVEVTEYTDSSISGTFSGNLADIQSGGNTTIQVSNGSFTNINVVEQ